MPESKSWTPTIGAERLAELRQEYPGLYRLPQVVALTGLAKSTLYAKVSRGEFPHHVKPSRTRTAWFAADVHAWLEGLNAQAVA